MAKKRIILGLIASIVLLLFLTGCTDNNISGQAVKEVLKEDISKGPKVTIYDQISTKAEEIPKKAVPPMPQEIQDIIAKADNIESIEYKYREKIANTMGIYMHVFVKGNLLKQIRSLHAEDEYLPGTRYDTVYINTAKKSVKAYCEDKDKCEDTDAVIPTNGFDEFITETPLILLKSIRYAEIKEKIIYDSKESTVIEFINDDGYKQKVWLWTFRGIPIKSEIYNKDNVLIEFKEYEGIKINHLTDYDFVH